MRIEIRRDVTAAFGRLHHAGAGRRKNIHHRQSYISMIE
jgi:hypothetical protein